MFSIKRAIAGVTAALLLTTAPAWAQGLRTVVVPGEGGVVVVAPRSAPPRLMARPAPPLAPTAAAPVVVPTGGTSLALPDLGLLPLLGGALLGAAGLAGGGGGSSAPARTR